MCRGRCGCRNAGVLTDAHHSKIKHMMDTVVLFLGCVYFLIIKTESTL